MTALGLRDDGSAHDAVAFVRSFVHRAGSGDSAYIDRVLAPDFRWASDRGEGERPYIGRPQSLGLLRQVGRMTPTVMFCNEDYSMVCCAGSTAVVAGTFTAFSNPMEGLAFCVRKRLTAVVCDAGGTAANRYQIQYLHLSNPPAAPQGAEGVSGLSDEFVRYMRALADNYADFESVEIRDVTGSVHVLRVFDVVELEADRQCTNVHCLGKSLRVRQGIGALARLFPADRFVEVRRGSVVNIIHARAWNDREVTLVDGRTVPIPVRRSSEIQERLSEMRRRVLSNTGLPHDGREGVSMQRRVWKVVEGSKVAPAAGLRLAAPGGATAR